MRKKLDVPDESNIKIIICFVNLEVTMFVEFYYHLYVKYHMYQSKFKLIMYTNKLSS